MEPLIISEQDMVNAICLFLSHEVNVQPDEIEVELYYDDEEAEQFLAEAFVNGQQHLLPVVKIITALRLWIDLYSEFDPIAASITLDFNETRGIYATIR